MLFASLFVTLFSVHELMLTVFFASVLVILFFCHDCGDVDCDDADCVCVTLCVCLYSMCMCVCVCVCVSFLGSFIWFNVCNISFL